MPTPPDQEISPLTAGELEEFEHDIRDLGTVEWRRFRLRDVRRLCALARLGLEAGIAKAALADANRRLYQVTSRALRSEHHAAAAGQLPTEWIDIVFDGPPSHESGRFVEVEDQHGRSISVGHWVPPKASAEHYPLQPPKDDQFWRLRFTEDDLKPLLSGDRPRPVEDWAEVTRQLGERVARLEAVRRSATPPHVHVFLNGKCECGDAVGLGPSTFASIAQSPEFQQMMTDSLMRDFVLTDRHLRKLLGPEEYEVVRRRLVMGGPRITVAPADQREADMQEAARTVEDLIAKLAETDRQLAPAREDNANIRAAREAAGRRADELQDRLDGLDQAHAKGVETYCEANGPVSLAPDRKPKTSAEHRGIARRIRESDYIREFASWQGDGDWLADATDDQLLDRILDRVNDADRLEVQIGAVLGLCREANMLAETMDPAKSVRAAIDRARCAGRHEADVERAALVAKLQLVREALGATLQPDGTDDVVNKARNREGVGAVMDRELEWFSVAEAIASRLGIPVPGSPAVAREAIWSAIAKLQDASKPGLITAAITSADHGRFAADLAAELPVRPWGSIAEQILRDVIDSACACAAVPAGTFEIKHRRADADHPPRVELHVHRKGEESEPHVLAYVELGTLWVVALDGVGGYAMAHLLAGHHRWAERIQAALDRK